MIAAEVALHAQLAVSNRGREPDLQALAGQIDDRVERYVAYTGNRKARLISTWSLFVAVVLGLVALWPLEAAGLIPEGGALYAGALFYGVVIGGAAVAIEALVNWLITKAQNAES